MSFRPDRKVFDPEPDEPATMIEALPLYLVMAFAGLCMGVGFVTIIEKVVEWL